MEGSAVATMVWSRFEMNSTSMSGSRMTMTAR
jgi:hypothetical protein